MPLPHSGGNKFLWIVLVIALVIGAWALSSLFQNDAFNVRATIKDLPPGIAQITAAWSEPSGTQDNGSVPGGTQDNGSEPGSVPDGTQDKGSEPSSESEGSGYKEPEPEPVLEDSPLLGIVQIGGQTNRLYINTDIDYGTVFPGQSFTGHFIIYLTGVDEDTWEFGPYSELTYTITLEPKATYEDMRPYLTVYKDPIEADSETDDTTNGDYYAEGSLSGSDISDKWLVTFTVPDEPGEFGEYQADILIEVPDVPD